MAAPVLADTAVLPSLVFSQTSVAVTFGGVPANDSIIFLYYGSNGNSGSFAARTWPAGFTELVNQTVSGGGVDNQLAVAWKRAASEASATYTLGLGGSGDANQTLSGLVWTGVNTTTAFDVTGAGQTGSFGFSIDIDTITTLTANAVHLIFVDTMSFGNQTAFAATGYTQAAVSAANDFRSWSAYKTIASPGATGAVTVSFDKFDTPVGFSLALKPAGAGADTPYVFPDLMGNDMSRGVRMVPQ